VGLKGVDLKGAAFQPRRKSRKLKVGFKPAARLPKVEARFSAYSEGASIEHRLRRA